MLGRVRSAFGKDPDAVFAKVKGVIHVGANSGQEIELYQRHGLSVLWVEPNPVVFEKLQANLAGVLKQSAIKALIADTDNVEYPFHLANNDGESSSILDLNLHREVWPEVQYERTIQLISKTLPTLLRENNVDLKEYDMLVMDTQGAELLVLKGAAPILADFTYIKAEVPDFESYKDCCQVKDLATFLGPLGFREYSRHRFAGRKGAGNYYDIVYKKDPPDQGRKAKIFSSRSNS